MRLYEVGASAGTSTLAHCRRPAQRLGLDHHQRKQRHGEEHGRRDEYPAEGRRQGGRVGGFIGDIVAANHDGVYEARNQRAFIFAIFNQWSFVCLTTS